MESRYTSAVVKHRKQRTSYIAKVLRDTTEILREPIDPSRTFKLLKSAKMLGIGKTTLYRKLKQYGIERPPTHDSIAVKAKIASLEAEIVRLRAQLPQEAVTA